MSTLDELFDTLARRPRPEDVAEKIRDVLGAELTRGERAILDRAAKGSLKRSFWGYSSMLADWHRPIGVEGQRELAARLFPAVPALGPDDAANADAVERYLRTVGVSIQKGFGASHFLFDRLNRFGRRTSGVRDSHRVYNRKFRLLRRMERRLTTLIAEQRKYRFVRVGKSSLATLLPKDVFTASASSASFVAYMSARSNLRSEFTVWGQQKAFDSIAEMLLERCRRDPRTSWLAIAHVHPSPEVLTHLSDAEKGRLLGVVYELFVDAADMLSTRWSALKGVHRDTMTVQRGNDSSTWNQTASAFNKLRDQWVALVYALGMEAVIERSCPGKAMRLIAADVASWHRAVGHTGDPNTRVWFELPAPWDVVLGHARCTREQVRDACLRAGLDPETSGWTAPRPRTEVAPFRPTPELVHGVTVWSPHLAAVLREAGWFSGKPEALRPLDVAAKKAAAKSSAA